MLCACDAITNGKACPELLGYPISRTIDHIPNAVKKAEDIAILNAEKIVSILKA